MTIEELSVLVGEPLTLAARKACARKANYDSAMAHPGELQSRGSML